MDSRPLGTNRQNSCAALSRDHSIMRSYASCEDLKKYRKTAAVRSSCCGCRTTIVIGRRQTRQYHVQLSVSSRELVSKADLAKRPSATEGCTSPVGVRSPTFPQAL